MTNFVDLNPYLAADCSAFARVCLKLVVCVDEKAGICSLCWANAGMMIDAKELLWWINAHKQLIALMEAAQVLCSQLVSALRNNLEYPDSLICWMSELRCSFPSIAREGVERLEWPGGTSSRENESPGFRWLYYMVSRSVVQVKDSHLTWRRREQASLRILSPVFEFQHDLSSLKAAGSPSLWWASNLRQGLTRWRGLFLVP